MTLMGTFRMTGRASFSRTNVRGSKSFGDRGQISRSLQNSKFCSGTDIHLQRVTPTAFFMMLVVDWGHWFVARGFASEYLFACAEFGTFGPVKVLAGLRAENQAHHWGNSESESTHRAKIRLKELFCRMSRSRGIFERQ